MLRCRPLASRAKPDTKVVLPRQSEIRIGLVGCGAVAELFYTPALLEIERMKRGRLVSIFDPDAQRARRIGRHFPSAQIANSLEYFTESSPELVIVASP